MTAPPTNESGTTAPQEQLRQQALKLMRYANNLTPHKLDNPLDPMVVAALDAWVDETLAAIQRYEEERHGKH